MKVGDSVKITCVDGEVICAALVRPPDFCRKWLRIFLPQSEWPHRVVPHDRVESVRIAESTVWEKDSDRLEFIADIEESHDPS